MSDLPAQFTCFLVENAGRESHRAGIHSLSRGELPDGDLILAVKYSALNYKDALAATGHSGVALQLPLVPGIDAVGVVAASTSPDVSVGEEVLVKAADFGTRQWGGWSELASVPAEWCYPIPEGLDLLETVTLGTAGFTAAQCVQQLERHGVRPDSGPVVVTGATGGVGVFAVMLLHRLGYEVVAVTGKADRRDWLIERGAARVVEREDVDDRSGRPMLAGRWAGAVDSVGGNTLTTLLRGVKNGGCVTACGLVGGVDLAMTVYPFILRGITLQGVDSANTSREVSEAVWRRLGGEYRLADLQAVATHVPLASIGESVSRILRGEIAGRTIVEIGR